MIPKLAAAFVIGGIAVGSIVWFARPKPAAVLEQADVVQAVPRAETPVQETPAPAPVPVEVPKPKPRVVAKAAKVSPPVLLSPPVAKTPAASEQPAVVQEPAPVVTPAPAPVPVVRNADPPPPAILKPSRETAPAQATPRQPQTVTIPAGTIITVRLRDTMRASRVSADDPFHATLDQPLIVDGMVLAERGTAQRGRVIESTPAGRVKGRASLVLELTQLVTSDGQRVDIHTETFRREAESGVKSDAAKAGVAAGIGAAIGAIAGGGKGAAIGAGVGGAAGAGAVLSTKGKDAEIPSETRLSFRLKEPVTLTEKLN